MVTLPVTLGDPNPQTTQNSTFCIVFHIFVVGEVRDFKFGMVVMYIIATNCSWKGVVTSRDLFKFWPLVKTGLTRQF